MTKTPNAQLNSAQEKRALFETMPVIKALLTMAIPTVVSQLITMIYNIADRIRYLRDKSGLTQTDLANKLGISRSAVNSWEMSLTSPSLSNLVEMSKIFKVTMDYLVTASEKMLVDISDLSTEEKEVVLKLISCLQNKD